MYEKQSIQVLEKIVIRSIVVVCIMSVLLGNGYY